MDVVVIGLVSLALCMFSPVVGGSSVPKDRAGNLINSEAHGKFVMNEVKRCKIELPTCHGLLITYRSGKCECRKK